MNKRAEYIGVQPCSDGGYFGDVRVLLSFRLQDERRALACISISAGDARLLARDLGRLGPAIGPGEINFADTST